MYTFFPLPRGSYVARSASSAYSLARDLTLFWSQDLMLLLRRSRRRVFLFPLINPKPECRSSRVPLLFLIRTQKLKKRQQDLLNNNNNNDVDHYLPFLSFPFLSFHFPLCRACEVYSYVYSFLCSKHGCPILSHTTFLSFPSWPALVTDTDRLSF